MFGCVTSRDVNMSALSRLWVIMKTLCISSCSNLDRAISECIDC